MLTLSTVGSMLSTTTLSLSDADAPWGSLAVMIQVMLSEGDARVLFRDSVSLLPRIFEPLRHS